MSDKVYEWILKSKSGFTIRQGVVCGKTKKDIEKYLFKSFNVDEKEILLKGKLTITVIGGIL